MKTGDHVQNGNGRTFQVGQLLGRGSWGKCYLAREESNGSEWVLKVPLDEEDLPRDPPRLAEACREIAREQARMLEESECSSLVDIEDRFIADDGSPAILMKRYPETLERRVASGCSLSEVLRVITETTEGLADLASTIAVHGTLKPSNLLIDHDGTVRLMDPVTPTLRRYQAALSSRDGYLGAQYLPPEVRLDQTGGPLDPSSDTFALAVTLYRAVMAEGDEAQPAALPDSGLDKQGLVILKDRIHNRLKGEPSNPRFQARLADRAAAIVNRAVSIETSPSPPYRFNRLPEFRQRLDEVTALVHPTVNHVGKLILSRPSGPDGFTTDEDVRFSCTIGATLGVETHEEISSGLAIFDQERNERLKDLACSYTVDRHPSGRFRFSFRVAELPPGTYLVRTAFTIRDSGHEPATAEGEFTIRAAAGYVPPRQETEQQPIPLERTEESISAPVEGAMQAPIVDTDADASPHPLDATPAESTVEPTPEPATPAPPSMESVAPVPVEIDAANEPTMEASAPETDVEEPEYRGAGRWSELPLPSNDGQEIPVQKAAQTSSTVSTEPVDRGPIGNAIGRALDLVRSDMYLLFLGGAGLIIVLLLLALWLLPSS